MKTYQHYIDGQYVDPLGQRWFDTVNPYTGAILQRTGYADQNAAQKVRSWTRFLHTGEAVGPVGQFLAGLACLHAEGP